MSLCQLKQIQLLKNELAAYKDDLTQKVSWVVCNKIDLFESEDLSVYFQNLFKKN